MARQHFLLSETNPQQLEKRIFLTIVLGSSWLQLCVDGSSLSSKIIMKIPKNVMSHLLLSVNIIIPYRRIFYLLKTLHLHFIHVKFQPNLFNINAFELPGNVRPSSVNAK